jgi:AhpD family alkylhydroperoxidase
MGQVILRGLLKNEGEKIAIIDLPKDKLETKDHALKLAGLDMHLDRHAEWNQIYHEAWRQMRDVQMSPKSALNGKTKELIGLAVSAQVPCRFCIIAHTEFAKLNGATDAEIKEAIGMASLTRELSTMLNGMQVDEAQFKRDVERVVKNAKAAAKKNPATAQR